MAPEGRYYNPRVIDTSYLAREPVTYNIVPKLIFYSLPYVPKGSLQLINYREKNKIKNLRNENFDQVNLLPSFS